MGSKIIIAYTIAILLSASGALSCQEEFRNALSRAAIYAEAEMPSHSQEIYLQLLNAVQHPWQRNIIEYDSGTVALQSGEWELAIKTLSAIELDEKKTPFFSFYLLTNLGIAHYAYAEELTKSENEDPITSFFHLKQAELAFKGAVDAACLTYNHSGEESCKVPKELETLLIAVKRAQALKSTDIDASRLQSTSLREVLPWIYYAIGTMIADLSIAAKSDIDTPLQERYGALFAKQLKSWEPLWERGELKKFILGSKENGSIFKLSLEQYQQAQEELSAGELLAAIPPLEKVKSQLKLLIGMIAGGDQLKGSLMRILGNYRYILVQERLRESYWKILQEEYLQLSPELQKNKLFAKSHSHLIEANRLFTARDTQSARAYLIASEELLREVAIPLEELAPLEQLNWLSERQMAALKICYLAQEKLSKGLEQLGGELQKGLLASAEPYYRAVYEEQREKYLREKQCQASPWCDAMPLFEEGKLAAKEAHLSIERGEKMQQIIPLQEKALEKWRKAALAIREQSRAHCPCNVDATPGAEGKKSSMAELLTTLEQMYREDHDETKRTALPAPVSKPW